VVLPTINTVVVFICINTGNDFQMRYIMPIFIFVIAYTISAAIALYFTVSNIMAIVQELVVRRHRESEADTITTKEHW